MREDEIPRWKRWKSKFRLPFKVNFDDPKPGYFVAAIRDEDKPTLKIEEDLISITFPSVGSHMRLDGQGLVSLLQWMCGPGQKIESHVLHRIPRERFEGGIFKKKDPGPEEDA